jgi:hypothetical protein
MARENFLWGAPRIHGEMLGFKVSQATVSRYLRTSDRHPGQSWRTFIRNQAVVFSHIQNLEQDSDSEPSLWDASGGSSEVAQAGLDAARGCWAAPRSVRRIVPAARRGAWPETECLWQSLSNPSFDAKSAISCADLIAAAVFA